MFNVDLKLINCYILNSQIFFSRLKLPTKNNNLELKETHVTCLVVVSGEGENSVEDQHFNHLSTRSSIPAQTEHEQCNPMATGVYFLSVTDCMILCV